MKLASMLLSAIILSCYSIQADAVDFTGANMNVPEPLISGPNMDMPEPNPMPLVKPSSNANQNLNQTGNTSSNQTQVIELQQEAMPMDVSGKWLIKLDDVTDRSLDLILWSSGVTRVMGFGTLTEDGASNSITASGSVNALELILIAKLAAPEYANQKDKEYDLDLFMVNNTLSGTYVMKSGGQFLGKGNATAVKQ